MAAPSLTYTLTNGNTADASQVMQNLNDILNGITDGTKDLTFDTLVTNGSTTLGSSAVDDITLNGSIATTLGIKTTTSYDIGSTSIGLRAIYLGDAGSAARCTKLLGATISAGWTFTFPTGAGTLGMSLMTNGSGVTSWRHQEKALSKTADYTATQDETLILCDATGGVFTITLPPVASSTGKRYTIKKIASDTGLNQITIDADGSETIDGATTTRVDTFGETVTLVCDGSTWSVVSRYIPCVWTAYTLAITATTSNPTKGTAPVDTAFWRRVGDSLEIKYDYFQNVAGLNGTGVYLFALPPNAIIDSTKSVVSSAASLGKVGSCVGYGNGSSYSGDVMVYDTTKLSLKVIDTGAASGSLTDVGSAFLGLATAADTRFSFFAKVPITNWKG